MSNRNPHIAQELLSHQAFLRRLAADLVGADADDLVQDVWERALERPPQHGRDLRGWLARVARNLVANRWRDEARRTEREERRASEQAGGDELDARFEMRKELVGAIDALSDSCRGAILLRYFDGLAPQEIARRQGVPVATVKTRLRRGLGQLREALDQRNGGERAAWMPAVTALAAPASSGWMTGTFSMGATAMGTMVKVSATVLVASACMYFVARTPEPESPPLAGVEPMTAGAELVASAVIAATEGSVTEVGQRSSAVAEISGGVAAARETHVLRVTLEGLTAEDARMATVTLTGGGEQQERPKEVRGPWRCQGLTSDFDLGSVLTSDLTVQVDHPARLSYEAEVQLSRGVQHSKGKTVHEVRVRLTPPDLWPEFTLAVRDARTLAHLEGVELRLDSGNLNAVWGQNDTSLLLRDGLTSPVALAGVRGAHEPDQHEVTVAGLVLVPTEGESPRIVELARRLPPGRGVTVSARAPGYAWGSISVDVSKGEHEFLLERGAELGVLLANVELERYAALDTVAMLCVYRLWERGGYGYVRFEPLNEAVVAEGLRLENLAPGEYAVAVELVGGAWAQRPLLAREELSLSAGEARESVLVLASPPPPPKRAVLSGSVSFPAFGGEEKVQLQLYQASTSEFAGAQARYQTAADAALSLSEMDRVGGALPTWSFRLEDLPVGLYQAHLRPFQKSWMIELPIGGAENIELVIPELAEVLVETIDAQTGERVPIDNLYYGYREVLEGQVHRDRVRADREEPGRFRFWTAPGPVTFWPFAIPSGLDYGWRSESLELVAGFQSVRFELEPVYRFHIEFHDGGAPPDRTDGLAGDAYGSIEESLRAVDHEGRLTRLKISEEVLVVEVSTPGSYEVSFEGVGTDRFLPIPPRLVDVRAGEVVKVVVNLRRK